MPDQLTRPLCVTMGEPAGIGPEITLAAWALRHSAGLPPFYMIADPQYMRLVAARVQPGAKIFEITEPSEAPAAFEKGLPVLAVGNGADVIFGKPRRETATAVIRSIDIGVDHVLRGLAAAIVTNPIQKAVLYDAGFHHPGHTEYLADLCSKFAGCDALDPIMMLAVPELKVVPLTIHIPLRQVADTLTQSLIVETCEGVTRALRRDFGIEKPRIAVAGLNPHAGEAGKIGHEEDDIIRPAVATLQNRGINVIGPLPADTLFHERARKQYDSVVCMYHDQALIPLKTINFDNGVNITLGLPIVRTSPDHGTALDIAGAGKARPHSLIAAILTATEIAARRASAGASPTVSKPEQGLNR